MLFNSKTVAAPLLLCLALFAVVASPATAGARQKSVRSSERDATGGVKGRVKVETGTPSDVQVVVRQDEREVRRATTDAKGGFEVTGLAPGLYGLTFRKPGLSVGTIERVEVKAGRVRSLGDNLYMKVDEGTLALLKGSVFDANGKSFKGARVELALVMPDGTLKKVGGRVSSLETGSFLFRLTPEAARYRVTARADGMETATQDIEIEGAAVFRVALTLTPAAKQ
ncbi:MAG TPA: carboxypeptidase-like regulatory domain-containing protein [Pyrinomonadaceae bacterium]|nr:carboxypeptidase-like regulatory domain-containing protein [Pyrinomonadaceae bacterium]